MSNIANVTPEVLKWARTTAHIPLEIAASKLSIDVNKLISWESGTSKPTINQAKKLSKIYKRPFAMLFLREIPLDFQPLQDFRKKGSKALSTASVFIIREIQQKQAWVSELNQEDISQKRNFVGRFTIKDNPKDIANDILNELHIDPLNYKEDNPLLEWIKSAEKKGIFIARSSFLHTKMKFDPAEFLGFSIADPFAPFIFINSNDWNNSQLFTLVHELAHLWLASSGISNLSEKDDNFSSFPTIELFCNEVAANVLMPESSFKQIFDINNIPSVSNFFNVSSYAVIVRAFKLNLITSLEYKKIKNKLNKEYIEFLKIEAAKKELQKKEGNIGGPNPFLLQINKNSRLFTHVVLDAYNGGIIEPTIASSLLNVRVNKFTRLEEFLYK